MFNKDKLHHAYLLVGNKERAVLNVFDFLEKELNFPTKANPDFYFKKAVTLGVEDSFELKNFQSKKALVGNKKILIVQTDFITSEAQNSLLKVFEETAENTHIFLISPSAENFLDTLKSRFQIVFLDDSSCSLDENQQVFLQEFLFANFPERSQLLKRFWEHKKDEKADKSGAISFLRNLESFLYGEFKKENKKDIPFEEIFVEINKGISFLNDRSPSIKMILEYIALIIPNFRELGN